MYPLSLTHQKKTENVKTKEKVGFSHSDKKYEEGRRERRKEKRGVWQKGQTRRSRKQKRNKHQISNI